LIRCLKNTIIGEIGGGSPHGQICQNFDRLYTLFHLKQAREPRIIIGNISKNAIAAFAAFAAEFANYWRT